jgi:hypothetical protein
MISNMPDDKEAQLEQKQVANIVRAAREGDRKAAVWVRRMFSEEHARALLDGPRMPTLAEVARIIEKRGDHAQRTVRERIARERGAKSSKKKLDDQQ